MKRAFVDTAATEMQPYVHPQPTPAHGFNDSVAQSTVPNIRKVIEDLRRVNHNLTAATDNMSRDMMILKRSNEHRITALEARIVEMNHAKPRHA